MDNKKSIYEPDSSVSNVVEKLVEDKEEVAIELAKIIQKHSNICIKTRGIFTIGLSGGSMAKFVCSTVPRIATDWSGWRLFFCDERLVPITSSDSTMALYTDGLLAATPLTKEQFLQVDTELDAVSAAAAYELKLRGMGLDESAAVEGPRFDMLLLGVGPDGHIASLFPGHAALKEKKAWVVPITDSPKPPSSRVTLTLHGINSTAFTIMAFAGAEKAEMVKRLRVERDLPIEEVTLPAAMVRPTMGSVFWILDKDADGTN